MDRISKIKTAILELISKQKYLYEDDYHDLCYELTASEASTINDWIIQSYIPIRKNDVGRKYKNKVKNIVRNPSLSNIKKIKSLPPKTRRASIQTIISDIEKLENIEKQASLFEEEKRALQADIDTYDGTGNLNWCRIKELVKKSSNNIKLISSISKAIKGDETSAKELGLLFKTIASFDKVSFETCVAEDNIDKVKGLEVFSSLNETEGMLFPFNKEHVTFHMGSVAFPIDIIFLTPTSLGLKVAKIINNAQPGTDEKWSCNEVSHVLEVPGGSCNKYDIKLGDLCLIK